MDPSWESWKHGTVFHGTVFYIPGWLAGFHPKQWETIENQQTLGSGKVKVSVVLGDFPKNTCKNLWKTNPKQLVLENQPVFFSRRITSQVCFCLGNKWKPVENQQAKIGSSKVNVEFSPASLPYQLQGVQAANLTGRDDGPTKVVALKHSLGIQSPENGNGT